MSFVRRCLRCKLLALSGAYCAGCGERLSDAAPQWPVSRTLSILLLAVFGVVIGFAIATTGFFPDDTQLRLTAQTAVTNCSGTYTYSATLERDGEPFTNAPFLIRAAGETLATLRTDQNGRLSVTEPFPARWCGKTVLLKAQYKGSFRTRAASAESPVAVRLPASVQLEAPRVATIADSVAVRVTVRDEYDGTLISDALIRIERDGVEQYATTNESGIAVFSFSPSPIGVSELQATFLGGDKYGTVVSERASIATGLASDQALVERLRTSVVTIKTPTSIGAGVILSHESGATILFTNRHVIENTTLENIRVRLGADFEVPIIDARVAPDGIDLAALVIDGLYGTPAPPAQENSATPGRRVLVIGSPLGLQGSVSAGIVSNFLFIPNGNRSVRAIQTDAAVNPGNSGGGLFAADDGTLLGIVSSRLRESEGIGFAISIDELRTMPLAGLWEPITQEQP